MESIYAWYASTLHIIKLTNWNNQLKTEVGKHEIDIKKKGKIYMLDYLSDGSRHYHTTTTKQSLMIEKEGELKLWASFFILL